MHVPVVLDHPDPTSFSAAVARHVIDGAGAAGHSVEPADPQAEGFDPRWSRADIPADRGAAASADLRKGQARIARADAICLAFPLFWWGMPAMIKGRVDRVWNWGWTDDQQDEPELSL